MKREENKMTKKEIIKTIDMIEKKQYDTLERFQKDFGISSEATNLQRAKWSVIWSLKRYIESNDISNIEDYLI